MKELYTTEEVAEMLKIHENTVVKLRKEGMPHIKVGRSIRFDANEVLNWLNEQNKEVKK